MTLLRGAFDQRPSLDAVFGGSVSGEERVTQGHHGFGVTCGRGLGKERHRLLDVTSVPPAHAFVQQERACQCFGVDVPKLRRQLVVLQLCVLVLLEGGEREPRLRHAPHVRGLPQEIG